MTSSMVYQSNAQTRHAYVAEATFGTTPGTPSMQALDHVTGSTFRPTKPTIEDDGLRASRQDKTVRHGQQMVEGDLNFNLAYGIFDDFLAMLFTGAWTSDELIFANTFQSITLERGFLDIGVYQVLKGLAFTSLNLRFDVDTAIKGKLTGVGQTSVMNTTQLAAPTAAADVEYMVGQVGTLNEGGGAIAIVTGMEFTITNPMEPAKTLTAGTHPRVIPGRIKVEGKLDAWFDDKTLHDKFVNETETSCQIQAADPAGNTYDFYVDAMKYTGAGHDIEGEGGIVQDLPFMGYYDTTETTAARIVRAAA